MTIDELRNMYNYWYMETKKITAFFYRSKNGQTPVLDWLRALGKPDSAIIGKDLRLVELGWPLGMPLCRSLGDGLFEVRSDLPNNRTARVLFFASGGRMGILHGFIKKTQKTPRADIELARARKKEMEDG